MVYRPKGKRVWYVKVPTRTGWKPMSTRTHDKAEARSIARMVAELGPRGQRRFDLLDAVADGRLTLPALRDHWRDGTLDEALATLRDVDLGAHVAAWLAVVATQNSPLTLRQYRQQVRAFFPVDTVMPRSTVTTERLLAWLAALPYGPTTRRGYTRALSLFFKYLVRVGIYTAHDNPMLGITAPRAATPRVRWLPTREMQRVVDGAPEPYRSYFATLYGTGIEVSVGCRLTRRDVDVARREIFAAGTKTGEIRERVVRVSEWAWPYVEAACQGKLPDAPLFPGVTRRRAAEQHVAVCMALGLPVGRDGYQLRDSRHSWAVRAARAGTPAEIIARQLGHVDATMVHKVYGRFLPSQHDRDKWERLATLQDAASEDEARGQEGIH